MSRTYPFVKKVTESVLKGKKGIEKFVSQVGQIAIEYVPVNDIKANDYNPNMQTEKDFRMLVSSIVDDGFTVPILVHRPTMEIIDGEHRWHAAKALNIGEVPVVFTSSNDVQRRISTLRHGRGRGHEEYDKTVALFKTIAEDGSADWLQDSMQLSDAEMRIFTNKIDEAAATLAAETLSEAWDPAKIGNEITELLSKVETATLPHEFGMGGLVTAATQDAATERVELEKQHREASSSGKREEIRQTIENDTFRIQLLFSKEQAKIVRAVLGMRPAEKLIEICTPIWEADEEMRKAEEERIAQQKKAKQDEKDAKALSKELEKGLKKSKNQTEKNAKKAEKLSRENPPATET